MSDTTDTPETPPETPETETPEVSTDDLSDADRERLTEVVRKERAAAKAARTTAEQAEARLAELEAADLRRSVADEKGLSPEQAQFLTGEDAEQMAASADALLAAFPARETRRSPHERLRTGATGATEPAESIKTIADRVTN